MRVLHLDTGRQWRGGQAQVLLLLRGLAARGHSAVLLAPPGPLLERARAAGLEAEAWSARGDWDLAAAASLAGRLKRLRPELVHGHDARAHAVALLPARLAGVPLVVSRRVPRGVRGGRWGRLKYGWGVARYLCVSRRAMERMEAAGVAPRRLALVRSGVELDAPAAPDPGAGPAGGLRAEIGIDERAPLVGTIAALTAEKNPFLLLAVAPAVLARFPEACFVWLGDGPLRSDLERARDRAGLAGRFQVLGFREDARRLLRQLTLFVLPSSWEGLGTSLLDAQAAGVPVVATAVGGVPEVVEDGVSGRLVPPGDAAALAAAVIEALQDRHARERWSAAGRVSVRAFGAGAMVEGTLEQYRQVLAERLRRSE